MISGAYLAGRTGAATTTPPRSTSYLTKSAAGNGTLALTTAEAAYTVIEFTGVLTGNKTVTIPGFVAGSEWLIYNNTSGSYSLTFKGQSGSGVAITQGKRVHLYDSGSEIYASTAEV